MNRLLKRSMSIFGKNLISPINNFYKHNSEFIKSVEIKINNEKLVNKWWPTHIYSSTIQFEKNGMSIYKYFKNDDFKGLIEQMNSFIDKEIKI